MIADYDISAKLNKMFINTGEIKMTEQDSEKGRYVSETEADAIVEQIKTARVGITGCNRHLKAFLADRSMLLRQGKQVLDKLHHIIAYSSDGYSTVTQEYIQLQDAYIDLLETKDKIKDEDL